MWEALIMRPLAPLSHLLALAMLRWAIHPRYGCVGAAHPDAHYVGQRIVHYETLLGLRPARGREGRQ